MEVEANINQLQGLINNSNSKDCDVILINSIRIIKSLTKENEELREGIKEALLSIDAFEYDVNTIVWGKDKLEQLLTPKK